jgi:hypothetical protein
MNASISNLCSRLLLILILFASGPLPLIAQWVQVNGSGGASANSLAINGINLLAGTDDGVFLSTNSGANWTSADMGLLEAISKTPS